MPFSVPPTPAEALKWFEEPLDVCGRDHGPGVFDAEASLALDRGCGDGDGSWQQVVPHCVVGEAHQEAFYQPRVALGDGRTERTVHRDAGLFTTGGDDFGGDRGQVDRLPPLDSTLGVGQGEQRVDQPQVDNVYTPANGYFPLAPWPGFAVLCGWTALALLGATLLIRRRDA